MLLRGRGLNRGADIASGRPLGGCVTKFMKVSKYLSGRRLRIGGCPPTYGQTHAAGGPLTTVWGPSGACTGPGGPIAWFGGPEEVS